MFHCCQLTADCIAVTSPCHNFCVNCVMNIQCKATTIDDRIDYFWLQIMTSLERFNRLLRSETSLEQDNVMMPSSAEHILSHVTRRKARVLRNDSSFLSSVIDNRIPNIRLVENASYLNEETVYGRQQIESRVDMRLPRRRSSPIIREHRIKSSSRNRDNKDINNEVDLKNVFQLPTKYDSNPEGLPLEIPASLMNFRLRTSSIPKKTERAIYERSTISRSLVSNLPQNSYSVLRGSMLHPSLSLPQLVKQDEKDQKSKSLELCCDKCDAKHDTDDCPHYKKKREGHIDAQKNGWKLVGGSSNLPGSQSIIIPYIDAFSVIVYKHQRMNIWEGTEW